MRPEQVATISAAHEDDGTQYTVVSLHIEGGGMGGFAAIRTVHDRLIVSLPPDDVAALLGFTQRAPDEWAAEIARLRTALAVEQAAHAALKASTEAWIATKSQQAIEADAVAP